MSDAPAIQRREAQAPESAAVAGRFSRHGLSRIGRELSLVGVLAVLTIVVTAQQSRFLSVGNLQDLALSASILVILAIGETAPVLTRNIDLSVGSTLGMAAYFAASLIKSNHGVPLVLVLLVGCGTGAALGLFNALLVAVLRIPAIVATLGTLYLYRGLDYLLAGRGDQINAGDLPGSFTALATDKIIGIPLFAVIAVVLVVVIDVWLRTRATGRNLYFVGSNPHAAAQLGIPVKRHIALAYLVSGTLAGFAGVLWASFYANVDPSTGTGLELTTVAAVVVGGVAIFGGSGSALGAALGALVLTAIQNALSLLNVNPFYLEAIYGAAILLAVVVDSQLSARLRSAEKIRRMA